ncbi:MAG: PIN domain-containing protein [Candidatus Thorarchaeota archaeon SMTZ1-45]
MRNSQSTQKILLDTSFLLPTLGIDVEQEVMQALQKLDSMEIQLFYSDWSLLESSWIAIRQIKQGKYQEPIFRRGLLSITKTRFYNAVSMSPDDYLTALSFFQRGHTDMIDNLLYASALRNQYRFLTIDDELSQFITENKIENVVLTPKDI